MSADNGIYIAKFTDGYRVAEAQAIENVWYYDKGTKERKEMLQNYFGKSEVFATEDEAFLEAKRQYKQWYKDEEQYGIGCPLEYGICLLDGTFESFI